MFELIIPGGENINTKNTVNLMRKDRLIFKDQQITVASHEQRVLN
jgi:hypothetical protein